VPSARAERRKWRGAPVAQFRVEHRESSGGPAMGAPRRSVRPWGLAPIGGRCLGHGAHGRRGSVRAGEGRRIADARDPADSGRERGGREAHGRVGRPGKRNEVGRAQINSDNFNLFKRISTSSICFDQKVDLPSSKN
jgi:hypothetical protein